MDGVTRSAVQVEGAEISVLSAGPEGGEAVFLLHGIPAGAELWRDTLNRLAAAGYRGYAPDLPGYGGTRLPEGGDHSLGGAAALFIRWLRLEGMGPAWVVGHDLGGCVAQIMAVRQPDLVGRLTLSHSPVEDSWPVPIVRFLRLIARLRLYSPLAALRLPYVDPWLRLELRRAFAHPRRLKEADLIGRVFFDTKLSAPEGRRKFAAHLLALDPSQTMAVADGLREVHLPTLLLWGRKDPHQPWHPVGERLRELLPASEVFLIEDGGHFAMLDQPEEFTNALVAWRPSGHTHRE